MILAIDPGPEQSGYVLYDGTVLDCGVLPNVRMLTMVQHIRDVDVLAIEGIASQGKAVGASTFDTCIWIGRFGERFGWSHVELVYRMRVKLYLCGSNRVKDTNIRQALIDRFGGIRAIGLKASPGPLYKVKSHAWSALAVAVTVEGDMK